MIFAAAVLVFFTTYGAINIKASKPPISQTPKPPITISNSSTGVLGKEVEEKKLFVVISTQGLSPDVNIHESPGASSPIRAKASQGDTFELITEKGDWYQIKLIDGSTGFVSALFSKVSNEGDNP